MGKQKSSDSQQQENSGEPSDQESGELSDQDFSAAEASEQEQWDGQQQSNSQQARKAARAARQARQSKSGSCPHGKKDGECSSCKNGGVHGNQTVLPGGKAKSGWGSSSGNYDTQAAVLGQGKQENRFGDEQRRADEREFMNRMRQSQMNPNTADTRVKGERGDGPIVGERSIPIPAGHETPTVGVGAPADPVAIEKRSLDQQDIPLDYRPSVRRYFDSIEVPKN